MHELSKNIEEESKNFKASVLRITERTLKGAGDEVKFKNLLQASSIPLLILYIYVYIYIYLTWLTLSTFKQI